MRQRRGKPSKWQWILAAGALLAGLLLLLPPVPAFLRENLPPVFIPVGIILLIILMFQVEFIKSLPQEEQRERERADRDERNDMIQGKAASILLDLETWLLILAFFIFGFYYEDRTVFQLLLWLNLFRILAMEVIRWWLNRKY